MSKMKDKFMVEEMSFDEKLMEIYLDESYQEWLLQKEEEDLKYQIEHDDETIPF